MKHSVLLLFLLFAATAAQARDPAQVRAFRHTHPCPATHSTTGACSGWVVDHLVPLCGGGADKPANMQWQRTAESYKKDTRERAYCKCIKTKSTHCVLP